MTIENKLQMSNGSCTTCVLGGERFGEGRRFTSIYNGCGVNGGVKICHWGGAKVGQFGVRALERAALK